MAVPSTATKDLDLREKDGPGACLAENRAGKRPKERIGVTYGARPRLNYSAPLCYALQDGFGPRGSTFSGTPAVGCRLLQSRFCGVGQGWLRSTAKLF